MAEALPKKQNIQVYLRLRPFSKQEIDIRSQLAVEAVGLKELLIRQQHGKKYAFDRVFDMFSKQSDVYENVCQPMIQEVLMGYNCTVFAYGQTGTGKTYTMEGILNTNNPLQMNEKAGIILRAATDLYDNLLITGLEHSVRISYMELYNEEIFDLLSEDSKSLRIYEDQKQKGSVIINELEEVMVNNAEEVMKVLHKGSEKRRTAETLMNQKSSRSHAVFTVTVHIRETTDDGEEVMKIGKINFVDLAGSENISRSGAIDKRAREAGSINQSLLTLGRVIKALTEKSLHIPYRESKLTRILQDSLGGKTKTSLIATISPGMTCLEETLSTLDYANRARRITNKPEINQRMSKRILLNQYTEEIERLQKDLMASRSGHGIFLDEDNYQRLLHENDMRKLELTNRITQIRDLQQRIDNTEMMKKAISNDFLQCKSSLLDIQTKYRQSTEEHEKLLNYVTERGRILQKQATKLLKVADSSTKNENILIDKLNMAYGISDNTKININNIIQKQQSNINEYVTKLEVLQKKSYQYNEQLLNDFSQKALTDSTYFDEVSEEYMRVTQSGEEMGKILKTIMQETKEKLSVCKAKNNFDELDDIIEVTEKAMQESIILEFQKLYNYVQDHNNEKRDALLQSTNNLHSMKEHNENTIKCILNLTTTLNSNVDLKNDIVKKSYEILRQEQSSDDDFKKDFMDTITGLMTKYDDFNKSHKERMDSLQQNIYNFDRSSFHLNENVSQPLSKIGEDEAKCLELAEENLNTNELNVESLTMLELKLNEYKMKVEEMTKLVHEKTVESVKNTGGLVKDNMNSLISLQKSYMEKINCVMEEQVEDIMDKYQTHLLNVQDKMKYEADFMSDIQRLTNEKHEIEEKLNQINIVMLNDIKTTLLDIEGKIILPQPSGDTPVKNIQKYPRRLVDVVPVNLNQECDLQNDFSIIEEEPIAVDEISDTLNTST